jgi:predicted ATPase/DNA-binding SARP family transcriptional activator
MSRLQIRLLGDFQATYADAPITHLNQPRLQSLLAYLLLHRAAPQSRQHLAFTLWPDAAEAQARNNLRQLLFQLRRALPDGTPCLHSDASAVWWEGEVELDVSDFDMALTQADGALQRGDEAAARDLLAAAARCYTGDLLPGCYDEWAQPVREQLRQRCFAALQQLAALHEAARDYPAALAAAERLRRLEPLCEETYVTLMRLHALSADRAGALRVYHECAALFEAELGVEPLEAVRAVYERLRLSAGKIAPGERLQHTAAPLIGRRVEWQRLRAVWQQASGGHAHFVLIAGEAGIGKTRLADELLDWAAQQGIAVARARAYQAEGGLPYAAAAEWLRSAPIIGRLPVLDDPWLSEIARLLPELLVDRPDLAAPGPLTERWQRQRFFTALARGLLASGEPLVLQFDDLQWCDAETLEWLHFLMRCAPNAPLLIIGTLRVEERSDNPALPALLQGLRRTGQLSEIELMPLDAAETAHLAASIAGRELDTGAAMRLFRETEGNPLFITEMAHASLTRAVGAPESAATGDMPLPPIVYGVIAGRLSQLSPDAGRLVGVAATIGRSFTVGLLSHVVGRSVDALVPALDELWQRRIIREHGVNTYDFSHDRLRDVAYRELSPIQRRALHGRIARALEALSVDDPAAVSAQLATHYEQAGAPQQAIGFYERAALAAQRIFAHGEAIQLLHRALALLGALPAGHARDERELTLQTELGASLVALRGYSDAEAVATYGRARALYTALERPPGPPILRGLALTHIVRAESQQAYLLGAQIHELAQQTSDPVLLVEAEYVQGVALTWQGRLQQANVHLRAALAHYDARHTRTHLALYAQDPRVICMIRLAGNLWIQGAAEASERTAAEAHAHARALAHPFTLTYASYFETQRLVVAQDVGRARDAAEMTLRLCRDYQIDYWAPLATICAGWARGMQGDLAGGIEQIREGIACRAATNTPAGQTLHLGLLAQLYMLMGDAAHAGETMARALTAANRTGEQLFSAELHRLQGELLLREGETGAAAEAFQRALAIAQAQEARAFVQRITPD